MKTGKPAQATFEIDSKGHASSGKVCGGSSMSHHHAVSPMMKDESWRTRANNKPLKITRH